MHLAPTATALARTSWPHGSAPRLVYTLKEFPAIWSDCWLALLPKVANPTLPRQLRPIGLTESASRVLAGHLQAALKPYLLAFVGTWRGLYLPGRGTTEGRVARFHFEVFKG